MAILVSESEAVKTLPALLNKVRDESVIITDEGMDVCAMVSMTDYELIRKAKNDRLFAAMDALGHEIQENAAKQGISMEEVARMLDCNVS